MLYVSSALRPTHMMSMSLYEITKGLVRRGIEWSKLPFDYTAEMAAS